MDEEEYTQMQLGEEERMRREWIETESDWSE